MMATIEGRGIVRPQEIIVPITDKWRRLISAESKRRGIRDAKSRDSWVKGIIPNAHEIGMLSELAVAEYLNIPHIDFTQKRDAGWDLEKHKIKIQVKATTRSMPLVKQQRKKRSHVFVFCRVTKDAVHVLGWLPYEEVVSRQLVDSVGPWVNHAPVEPEELNAISEFHCTESGNLVRYPGGKSRLWEELKQHIPRGDMFDPDVFVEPFVGGGAILTRLLKIGQFKRYIINDMDRSLVALWMAVRDNPGDLARMVLRWKPSVEDWFHAKSLDGEDVGSPTEQALRKLILHFCSHGGLGYMAGGPQGGVSQDSDYPIGCRWNPIAIAKRVMNLSPKMQTTDIHCGCFSSLDIPDNAYIFCDPPYVKAGDSLYRHAFTEADHRMLRDWLSDKRHWTVTYDSHPLVRELYSSYGFTSYENDTGNNRKHMEWLITNEIPSEQGQRF